jgi:hypothetical protein
MKSFLEALGFARVVLQGVRELVWGKVVRPNVCLRVYSGINPDGHSRAVGTDAIRVALFWRDTEGAIHKIGAGKRVHRVQGWRKNLKARLDGWKDSVGPSCPKCKAPMALRKGRNGNFYGCVRWKKTGCKGSANANA